MKTPDILTFEGILASSFPNLNDDMLFDLFEAKNTIVFKPVDIEHNIGEKNNKSEIVGVVTSSIFTDESGKEIAVKKESDLPQIYSIGICGVIWKWLFKTRAEEIEDDYDDLSLSMECYFTEYNYGLLNDNKIILVKRNKNTAKLDKYLKTKGGKGLFKGKRLYRIIRNPIFGAVAIVKSPANPLSIIKEVAFSINKIQPQQINMTNFVGKLFSL